MVKLMCNGTFKDKDPDEAMEYLDSLAENAQNWDTTSTYEALGKTQPHTSSGVSKGPIITHTRKHTTVVGEIIQTSVGRVEKGMFPSQPQQNPKGQYNSSASSSGSQHMDQVKSFITLRSGNVIEKPTLEPCEKDGRPFLATFNALINCRNGLMKLSFGNMTLEMNIFNICKQPGDDNDLQEVDLIEELVYDQFESTLRYLLAHWSTQDKRKFLNEVKNFYWDDPYLFKYCPNQIFQRCIPDNEACANHLSSKKTTAKILQRGFYWPTMFKDTHAFCKTCENYQKLRSISKRHMMPLNPILVIEIFDCWGIDFMGLFSPSFGFVYILVAVDYVSKWIEAILSRHNDHKTVIKFLKENILSQFGIPRATISDGGTHFCNKPFESLMKKYGITHKVATPYHP
eukprot:XP_024454871.1 uncharacterized protein LOC112327201 [Populus trichocarpa]